MWVVLALVAATCTALRDVASKRATLSADPALVALGIAAVPAVGIGAVVLVRGAAAPDAGFWTALLVSGGINAVATPLVVVALKRSDLSLVAPLTSLTPLFMIGTGALILGEVPGPAGLVGVVVIVAGAYLLSMSDRSAGVLAPFRALLRDPGARLMLLVALLYSVSATYDKVGTRASTPLFWAAAINGVTATALVPVVVWRARRRRAAASRERDGEGDAREGSGSPVSGSSGGGSRAAAPAILAAGALTAIGAAAQMTALLLTLAAYVIAVKRISTLIGVVLGHSVFREEHVRQRLLGAAVMLAGFLLVTLS